MNQAREIRPVHDFPDPSYHANLQCLEREITELAAHIAAATYELLVLSLSEAKGLQITARTLPADCGGEIDYNYAQGDMFYLPQQTPSTYARICFGSPAAIRLGMHLITEIWWVAAMGTYDLTAHACCAPVSEHSSPLTRETAFFNRVQKNAPPSAF